VFAECAKTALNLHNFCDLADETVVRLSEINSSLTSGDVKSSASLLAISPRMVSVMNSSATGASVQFHSIKPRPSRRIETIGKGRQWLEGRQIDSDPRLMDDSLQLRYQVYCVERRFFNPDNYPDRREYDEYDGDSLHLGVVDGMGSLLATARLVKVNVPGLPLFRHCRIYAHETELYRETNRVVEVSRLCVSRHLRRYWRDRRSVVTILYRALFQVSKQNGFTHWLVATERSLQRLVTDFGFPFRAVGPCSDYCGEVAPYLMNLHEFEEIIQSRTRPALASFLDGQEAEVSQSARVELV